MLSRSTLLKLAGIVPVAILATGLFFAVRPAMNSTPVDDDSTALEPLNLDEDDRVDEPLAFAEGRMLWPASGQSVVFEYESSGCFHSEKRQLEVVGGALDPQKDGESPEATTTPRTAAMTPTIRADIEKTIGYLRSKPRGGCTTMDTVTITWKTGATIDATETLIDASCELSLGGQVKTLGDIIDGLPATRLDYHLLNP